MSMTTVIGAVTMLVLIIIGWVVNIIKLTGLEMGNPDVLIEFVLRIVGIFIAPLGVILGWFV